MKTSAQQTSDYVSEQATEWLRREAVIHEVILAFNANEINVGECELFVSYASKWTGDRQPRPFQDLIGKAQLRDYYGNSRPPALELRDLTTEEEAIMNSGGIKDFLTPGQLLAEKRAKKQVES